MLQQDYLFEWRTILENAVLGAEIQGVNMVRARERAVFRIIDEDVAVLRILHGHVGGLSQARS